MIKSVLRCALLPLVLSLGFLATSCVSVGSSGQDGSSAKSRQVALHWIPSDDFSAHAWKKPLKVKLGRVEIDTGDKPIWSNVEDDNHPKNYTVSLDAETKFVNKIFATAFPYQDGPYVLDVTINTLSVTESWLYNGQAAATFTLLDASGAQLWTGVLSTKSKRWGHSESADNFNECIGSCLSDLVVNAMTDTPELSKYY